MPFTIDDLNYDKDSKERMPWEHYTEEFGKADPAEIAGRLSLPYDEEKKELTLKFLGSVYYISWPDFQVSHEADDMGFYPLETMTYARTLTIRFLLNGAEASNILRLLVCDILYVSIPSILLGIVIAYFIGKAWLEQFAEQVDLNPLLFLATALIVAIIIVACVVLKAWHIANENPVNSIKSE